LNTKDAHYSKRRKGDTLYFEDYQKSLWPMSLVSNVIYFNTYHILGILKSMTNNKTSRYETS
jgi:hypothetical protein